jgi:geranylgeranyl reductase family protein
LESVDGHDVVIIGAGPAGSSAALELERLGIDHLLIDRAVFPRPKPCAGLLPPAVEDILGKLPRGVVEKRIRGYFLHSALGGEHRSRFARRGYSVDRAVFDGWLVSRLDGRPQVGELVGMERAGSRLRVNTDGAEFFCRVLIGADGANSKVRTLSGIPAPRMATAYQAQVPMAPSEIDRRTKGWFHVFYVIAGGYGWVAPHRDRLLVGTGSVIAGKVGKAAFSRFLQHPGVVALTGGRRAGMLEAQKIPMSGPVTPPGRGNILLAGDAGGFVFPGTGEGIRYAMMSGRAAARAAADHLKAGGRPATILKRYVTLLREGGLMSLGDVDLLDVLGSPERAHEYIRRLTFLSRRASSS